MINTVWDGNLQVDESISAFGEAKSHLYALIRNTIPQWTMSTNRGSFEKLEVKSVISKSLQDQGLSWPVCEDQPLYVIKHLDDALTKHHDTLILQQLQFNIFLCTDINCKLLTFVTTFKYQSQISSLQHKTFKLWTLIAKC